MGKKKNELHIASPYYIGLISKMPQDAKDKMKAEKPNVYNKIFEKKEVI